MTVINTLIEHNSNFSFVHFSSGNSRSSGSGGQNKKDNYKPPVLTEELLLVHNRGELSSKEYSKIFSCVLLSCRHGEEDD